MITDKASKGFETHGKKAFVRITGLQLGLTKKSNFTSKLLSKMLGKYIPAFKVPEVSVLSELSKMVSSNAGNNVGKYALGGGVAGGAAGGLGLFDSGDSTESTDSLLKKILTGAGFGAATAFGGRGAYNIGKALKVGMPGLNQQLVERELALNTPIATKIQTAITSAVNDTNRSQVADKLQALYANPTSAAIHQGLLRLQSLFT